MSTSITPTLSAWPVFTDGQLITKAVMDSLVATMKVLQSRIVGEVDPIRATPPSITVFTSHQFPVVAPESGVNGPPVTFAQSIGQQRVTWSATTNPDEVTIQVSGLYVVAGGVHYPAAADATGVRGARIVRNSTGATAALRGCARDEPAATSGIGNTISLATIARLGANDVLRVLAFHNDPIARVVNSEYGGTFLSVAWVGL